MEILQPTVVDPVSFQIWKVGILTRLHGLCVCVCVRMCVEYLHLPPTGRGLHAMGELLGAIV